MSNDLFGGLADSVRDRKQRDDRFRKQKWRAFWLSLGATVLTAVATGIGGACGGWFVERDSGASLDRFLGGVVYGFAGGVFFFLVALYSLVRRAVVNEVHSEREEGDAGAALFWATVVGTILCGSLGTYIGLAGNAARRNEVLACAIGAGLLALIPTVILRVSSLRKSRTGGGATGTTRRN